jgi:hypothetical protein
VLGLGALALDYRGIEDRTRDAYDPLLAVATAAGGGWPDRLHEAVAALRGRSDDTVSLRVRLLWSIREVFSQELGSFIGSSDLVQRLRERDDEPWMATELTTHKMAAMLGEHGIKPKQHPSLPGRPRGYSLGDFEDAFARYLPHVYAADDGELHERDEGDEGDEGDNPDPNTSPEPIVPSSIRISTPKNPMVMGSEHLEHLERSVGGTGRARHAEPVADDSRTDSSMFAHLNPKAATMAAELSSRVLGHSSGDLDTELADAIYDPDAVEFIEHALGTHKSDRPALRAAIIAVREFMDSEDAEGAS